LFKEKHKKYITQVSV